MSTFGNIIFKIVNYCKTLSYTTMLSPNKEMKSALRKQYQQKLFEMNDDNNPSNTYGKPDFLEDRNDDSNDEEENDKSTKRITEKVTNNKSSKSWWILF